MTISQSQRGGTVLKKYTEYKKKSKLVLMNLFEKTEKAERTLSIYTSNKQTF